MQQMMTPREYLETAPATGDECAAAYERMVARRSAEQKALMDEIDARCHACTGDIAARLAKHGLTKTLVHAADAGCSSTEIYRLHDDAGFVGTLTCRADAAGSEAVEYWLAGVAECYSTRNDFFAAYLATRGVPSSRLVAHDHVLAAQRQYYATCETWRTVCACSTDGQRIADACRLKARAYATWQQAKRDYADWYPTPAEGAGDCR